MTDQPLEQYQTYYGSPAQRALEGEADYVRLREAFYAGYRARPAEPIEPSRDALDSATRYLRAYGERFPQKPQAGFYPGRQPERGFEYRKEDTLRFYPPEPLPNYIQHGTVTGRLPRREQVEPFDKAQRFAEVYGAEPRQFRPADPEVLERVHDELTREGVVEYPSEHTNPGFPAVTRSDTRLMPAFEPTLPGLEHVATVWDGEMAPDPDETMHFGAPGPVPTPLSVQEAENG